jgi:chromosome partitioning protein
MPYIAIVSQKGGCGKSTIARALAREATVSNKLRVKLADLDTMQKTVGDWHAKRLHAILKPVGDVQIFATVEQASTRPRSTSRERIGNTRAN